MESCFSRYFVLICIIGGSTATNTSPDDSPDHHITHQSGAEKTDNDEISWSSQSPTIDLATRDVHMEKAPAELLQQIKPKSLDGNDPTLHLHAELQNTMHPTGQSEFVPRREKSSHLHRKRGDNSSSDSSSSGSSSSSSSEDEEKKQKKKDSHKRHHHDKKYSAYPSPSFYRGTQSPYEKRHRRHSPPHNNGYGQVPYPNRHDQYPAAHYPDEYGQYGPHRAGSRKRYSGNDDYHKYNQKPYPLSYHDQPARMNIPPLPPPMLAH